MRLVLLLVLIDTWWNVNNIGIRKALIVYGVLIDTWWNVNMTSTGYVRRDFRVLIDTWWNVNQEFVNSLLKISGFNRYMVECE